MLTRANRKFWLLFAGFLFLATSFSAVSAQQSTRSGTFAVRLESQRTIYQAGEPVNLRVTLTNRSGQFYAVFWQPPHLITTLHVVAENGYIVPPDPGIGAGGYVFRLHNLILFGPRQEIVQVRRDANGANPIEWINIRSWGYALKPGKYTISATGGMSGFERTSDGKVVKSTYVTGFVAPSNTIHIEILP